MQLPPLLPDGAGLAKRKWPMCDEDWSDGFIDRYLEIGLENAASSGVPIPGKPVW
jgi:hypothetical protein